MAGKKVTFDVLAVAKSEGFDKSANDVDKLAKKAQESNRDLKLLSTSVAALAPAMVPIGAAAVAAGASLAGLGAAGILAFEGIKNEMAAATPEGKAYSATLRTLKGDLDTLEATAAHGVFAGFQKSASSVHSLMPLVNSDVGKLSTALGDIASHAVPGLVRLFTVANPLLLQFANDLDVGAAKFDKWTQSSDGAAKFVAYAQAELPRVEQFLGSLAVTIEHVAVAAAPFGGTVLTELTLFSRAINAIPIGVLQTLVPLIAGLKVASTVSAGIQNLTGSLAKLAAEEDIAAASTASLSTALSAGLTPALFGLAGIYTVLGPVLDRVSGNSNTFTDALKTMSGATITMTGLIGAAVDPFDTLSTTQTAVYRSTTNVGAAMWYASDAADALKQAMDALNNTNLTVAQATTDYDDRLLALTADLKSNGKTVADNTGKGVENQKAIEKVVAAAQDQAQAIAKATNSTKAGTDAYNKSGQAILDHIAKQDGDRTAADRAKDAAYRFAQQLLQLGKIKVPPTKLDIDKANADAKTRAFKAELLSIPHYNTSKVQVDSAQALAKIRDYRASLDNLNGKTAYTYIDVITNQINTSNKNAAMNAARATGGAVQRGKTYEVNEVGTELFVPNSGAAYLIPGGPHMWKAPATGQIISAATLKGIRGKIGHVASASLAALPAAASSAIAAVTRVLPFGSGAVKTLDSEDRQLESLVARRATIASKLSAANTRLANAQKALADAQQQYAQEVSNVRSTVVGSFDLVNGGKDIYGETTFGGLLSDLQSSVSHAATFAYDLKALKGRLSAPALVQLAEAGPAALQTLQALVNASPWQLKQFNALYGRLGAYGSQAGAVPAGMLYGATINADKAGVAVAQGLIKGLKSQEAALDRQMQHMAGTLVSSLKRALGIHSPAAALVPLGRYTAMGFAKGIDAGIPHVTAASSRMAGSALPSPAGSTFGSSGGDIHIHVHAPNLVGGTGAGNVIAGELSRLVKGDVVQALRRAVNA